MREKCPKCSSRNSLREILWGMPAKEPDPSKYVLGGCCLPEAPENWMCLVCSWRGLLEE